MATFGTDTQDSSRSGTPTDGSLRAPPLPDHVLGLLGRPDLYPLTTGATVRPSPGLGQIFSVRGPGHILVDPDTGQGFGPALIDLRHALELAALLRLCPDRPAINGHALVE